MALDRKADRACQFDSCDTGQKALADTDYCVRHVRWLQDRGWKVYKNGGKGKDGVRINSRGAVTLTEAYLNPRTIALLSGEIQVEDLDPQELARGVCRNPDGTWPKKSSALVPKTMYDAMRSQLFRLADEGLHESLVDVVNTVVKIATSEDVDAATRLNASKWIFERLRGKVPDVVHHIEAKPYEVVLEKIHKGPRPTREIEAPEVLEAEVVEPETVNKVRRTRRGKVT